jgi:hypothetical protein
MKKIFFLAVSVLLLLQLSAQNCPKSIKVSGPTMDVEAGKSFQFIADISGLPEDLSVTYNWSISAGIITSGQGTSVITVEVGNNDETCTATVELGGLPKECNRSASATVSIKKAPEKIFTLTTVTNASLNDAIKRFISKTDLKNSRLSQNALVNVYAINTQQFAKIKTLIEKFFTANGILSYQYTIVNSGIAKAAAVEMFLIKNSY